MVGKYSPLPRTVVCPDCQSKVSPAASDCPHCGFPVYRPATFAGIPGHGGLLARPSEIDWSRWPPGKRWKPCSGWFEFDIGQHREMLELAMGGQPVLFKGWIVPSPLLGGFVAREIVAQVIIPGPLITLVTPQSLFPIELTDILEDPEAPDLSLLGPKEREFLLRMWKKGTRAIVQAFSKAIIAIGGAIVKFGEYISRADEGDIPRPAGPDPGPPRDAGGDEAGT